MSANASHWALWEGTWAWGWQFSAPPSALQPPLHSLGTPSEAHKHPARQIPGSRPADSGLQPAGPHPHKSTSSVRLRWDHQVHMSPRPASAPKEEQLSSLPTCGVPPDARVLVPRSVTRDLTRQRDFADVIKILKWGRSPGLSGQLGGTTQGLQEGTGRVRVRDGDVTTEEEVEGMWAISQGHVDDL